MPNHDATARTIFAELNTLADRHQDENHMVILAAVFAWATINAEQGGDEIEGEIFDMAGRIAALAEPIGAAH